MKCENCGSTASLVRHHPDYSKPLDTVTLCKSCHGKIHRSPLSPDSKKRVPRLQVLDEIRRLGGWVAPIDIARSLGRPAGTINRLCWTMARDGELVSDGSGKYAIRRLAA